ncbi:hypothetical protein GCM10018793_37790 [Streptomyces sulfonofaciens]|uniref:Uncharacterized protein n=1 Tax=Streptomyces sulfonofaciens TaxID=68272 RepID=A0A919GBR7_9ACTN|nr:hypothetical protein GCM10018793_37790 [Streptomyces sulfonofaciens]
MPVVRPRRERFPLCAAGPRKGLDEHEDALRMADSKSILINPGRVLRGYRPDSIAPVLLRLSSATLALLFRMAAAAPGGERARRVPPRRLRVSCWPCSTKVVRMVLSTPPQTRLSPSRGRAAAVAETWAGRVPAAGDGAA